MSNDLDLIKNIAYKYKNIDAKDSFLDELVGEGGVGLAKALLKWKPKKASQAYKYVCIDNAMKDYLRKSTRNNNEINIEEGVDACCDENCFDPEEQMIRKEELNEAEQKVLEIISELTEREQYVLFNHILTDEPDTLRTIAERYSCSKDSIMRDKKRILGRLKI